MYMEFKARGVKWILEDDYIYYNNPTQTIIPLQNIIQVELIDNAAFVNGEIRIKLKNKTFPVRLFFNQKQRYEAEIAKKYIEEHSPAKKEKEYRKKCNVCGQIICYTETDLKNSRENQALTSVYSLRYFLNSFGGSSYDKYENAKLANSANSRIVDYSKCPNCHSSDLTDVICDNSNPCASSKNLDKNDIEKIMQYKKLYDEGILTKEEFDAKKKELLDL